MTDSGYKAPTRRTTLRLPAAARRSLALASIAIVVWLNVGPGPFAAQRFSAPVGRVENVSFEQIPGGVINIFYDLISDSPDGVFSITVKASDDGGKTFNLTPSAITGDVANVRPGRQKKIVWRSGQDVAVLKFGDLKFDVVATAGTVTPAPEAAAQAPPPSGGSNMKWILPIAAGGAGAAAFLLLRNKEEACTFAVSPGSADVPFGGGNVTVSITASPAECTPNTWSTSSAATFVTLNPTSGAGNSSVTITVAANTGAARTANLTIAGQSFVVNQAGAPPCTSITASPNPVQVPFNGGSLTVNLALAPSGCAPNAWTASITSNPANFITNLNPSTGTGNGSFSFTAAANSGASRTGTIRVAIAGGPSVDVTVPQSPPPPCSHQVTRSPAGNVPANASTVTVSIIVSSQTCRWRAGFNPNPVAGGVAMLRFGNMSADGVLAEGTGNITNLMVEVRQNTTGASRTGNVVVRDLPSDTVTGVVSIIQNP
jgi:hypothetical protein